MESFALSLLSGFVGVLAGIFFSAVSTSVKRQVIQIKNTIVLAELFRVNLEIISIDIAERLRAAYQYKLSKMHYGEVFELDTVRTLRASSVSNLQPLSTLEEYLPNKHSFGFLIQYLGRLNRAQSKIIDFVIEFESQIFRLNNLMGEKLNKQHLQSIQDTSFELFNSLEEYLFASEKISWFLHESALLKGRMFSAVKYLNREAIYTIRGSIIEIEEAKEDLMSAVDSLKNEFMKDDRFRDAIV